MRTTLAPLIVALVLPACGQSSPPAYDTTACAGPPLGTIEARNNAMDAGYEINRQHDCIDQTSFKEIERQRAREAAARQLAQIERARMQVEKPPEPIAAEATTLAEARAGFVTALARPPERVPALPRPPAELFVRTSFPAGRNPAAPAFVTPDPRDGRKRPAILWLTGGDPGALDDFWTKGPDTNDQSARAFREAGLVMMFPTLRGNTQHGGDKEYFLGEVDDVLAAAEHLAHLPYVDQNRIYLGGHSTGGTLALLAAGTTHRFAAVFAFGPVADVDRYRHGLVPISFDGHDPRERTLRSPIHWLGGIASPTYVIEGTSTSGNLGELEKIRRASTNPFLRCIAVDGEDHFSVLAKLTRVIAARLAVEPDGIPFDLKEDEFQPAGAATAR